MGNFVSNAVGNDNGKNYSITALEDDTWLHAYNYALMNLLVLSNKIKYYHINEDI